VLLGAIVAVVLPAIAVTRRVHDYGWAYYRRVGPVYWMFPTDTVWAYRIGRYQVTCIEDPAKYWAYSNFCGQKLIIRCAGRIVLEDEGDFVRLEHDPVPGADLNANGLPDVVVRFDTFSSANYQKYRIYEFGRDGIATIAAFETRGEGTTARFVDADNDGIDEIDADDWVYDGTYSHPVPSMLLWDGHQFTRRTVHTWRRPWQHGGGAVEP